MKLVFEHGLHTHKHTHSAHFSDMFHARVCVFMLTALKRAKKPDEVCFVIRCTSTTLLYSTSRSLSFSLALSCVPVSCSLLLQVLIINDWGIKKPKKQFLLRFFDSHRVAFDSLIFGFFAHVVQVLNGFYCLSYSFGLKFDLQEKAN